MNKKFILGMVVTSLTLSTSFVKADALSTARQSASGALELINQNVNSSFEHDGFFEQAKNTLATVALDAAAIAVLNKMNGGEIRRRSTQIANINSQIEALKRVVTDEDHAKEIQRIKSLEASYQNKTTVIQSQVEVEVEVSEGVKKKITVPVNNTTTERSLTESAQREISQLEEKIRTAPSAAEKAAMLGQLDRRLSQVSGRIVSATRNFGLLINKVLVRGSQVILIADATDAAYVAIILNKNPEVMPVVSALVDKTGGKALIDAKANEVNEFLKSL